MKTETFDDFCRACVDLLRSSRVPYIVVGGVAVTVVGEPRFTADLDVIVFIEVSEIAKLMAAASAAGFKVDVKAELAAAQAGGSVRLDRGRFHLDLIVRSLFVEELALEHSRARRLFKRMVRIPSPEDLMILKVLAGRPRDLLDAEGILRRNASKFDRRYVEKVLHQVADLAEDHAGLDAWRRVVRAVEKA